MGNLKYDSPKKALFVIDIQEDYTGAAAKCPFPYKDSEKLIETVNKTIEEASKKNIIIIYIRQEFDGFVGRMLSKLVALKRGYGVSIIKDGIALLIESKWDKLIKEYEQDGITLITSNEF